MINISCRVWSAAAAATVAALCGVPVLAQTAAMHVGATVAPRCRINVEPDANDAGRGPGVRVQCGRAGLKALRVTTDRGDGLRPMITVAGRQMLAGGDVLYLAPPQPLATLASLRPAFAPPPPADQRPVTITLDF